MNKILLSGLASLAVIGVANGGITTEVAREICLRHPDKYIWVENTKRCIPINPCKSDNETIVNTYCNRTFNNVQTHGALYKGLIELYSETHALQCEPVDQKAKLFGQDYVLCSGNDVMMFEFDDIHDSTLVNSLSFYTNLANGLCDAVSGNFDGDNFCVGISDSTCRKIAETIKKYPLEKTKDGLGGNFYVTGTWYIEGKGCMIENKQKQHGHYYTLGEFDPNYDSEYVDDNGNKLY